MAKEYKVGEKYYLPVTVERIVEGEFGVTLSYADGDEGDTALIWNTPDLLLTAEEITEKRLGRAFSECYPTFEELKSRNAELEALLKEVMATRDEAIKQNNELIAENSKLKAENDEWQKTARCYSENARGDLELTRKLRAEIKGLKAERDDLKSQVGKNTVDIQDMAAEIHFLKEKSGKQTEETTKHAHVVLNDGTELAFTQKATQAFYRDDVDMLFISDGDGVIAGFNRGDKPTNFAYFF